MTGMSLYLITRLDNLVFLFSLVGGIGLGITGIALIPICVEGDFEEWKPRIIKSVIICSVSLFLACFIPTTKEMAFIIIAPKIANSQFVQEIPADMIELKSLAMEYIKKSLTQSDK